MYNLSKGKIKETVALAERILDNQGVEGNSEHVNLGKKSPYFVLWRADLRFYLTQGLAVAGLKMIAKIKEIVCKKNDLKSARSEVIEL